MMIQEDAKTTLGQNVVGEKNAPLKIPTVSDPNLAVELYSEDLDLPVILDFLGPDDILVTEKDKGTVQRIVNGTVLEKPVLDVPVATISSRGLLGIAIDREQNPAGTRYVFLYYTESGSGIDGDDRLTNGTEPLGNRLYRYEWKNNTLTNPLLLLDLPVGVKTGVQHNGGIIRIGPDGNVYLIIGDLNEHKTQAQNLRNGPPADGTSAIYRITKNGTALHDNPLDGKSPVDKYYAYGVRNSFGMDFDPVTGTLWETENGPNFGDEINLVEPGFNSGWKRQMAFTVNPFYPDEFVVLGGDAKHGKYSDPELVWDHPIGVSALTFLNSDSLGKQYANDMLVGDVNYGNIYRFDLDKNRTSLQIYTPLADRTAQNQTEVEKLIFGKGFGRISDIKQGPDGYIYVVDIGAGKIWRIVPANVLNNVNRLIQNNNATSQNETQGGVITLHNNTINMIGPKYTWRPIYDVEVNTNESGIHLSVNTKRNNQIFHRAYLLETLNSTSGPTNMTLIYSSNSLNGSAKYAFEILNSKTNKILVSQILNDTRGTVQKVTIKVPPHSQLLPAEFRLEVITDTPGYHILNVEKMLINRI